MLNNQVHNSMVAETVFSSNLPRGANAPLDF